LTFETHAKKRVFEPEGRKAGFGGLHISAGSRRQSQCYHHHDDVYIYQNPYKRGTIATTMINVSKRKKKVMKK